LVKLFLKLGTISFGGPAVYIAMMEAEAVGRRQWLNSQQFLDRLGLTYLIPGPNAVEMAWQIGQHRSGLVGALAAAAAFTFPAAAISTVLAVAYTHYRTLPAFDLESCLRGIKPVVVALVAAAACRLAPAALGGWQLLVIAGGVAAASLAGCDEVSALLGGAIVGALLLRLTRRPPPSDPPCPSPQGGAVAIGQAAMLGTTGSAIVGAAASGAVPFTLGKLALFFLKVGAVMYGSGYVLVAYLEGGLVTQYGWLSHSELLDAVAIGQVTPGPFLSTVSFIGYLLGARTSGPWLGLGGAAVATAAILLPGLMLAGLLAPWLPRLRGAQWTALLLDAVGAAAWALMAAVTWKLGAQTLGDWPTWLVALAAFGLSLPGKLSPLWLILGGLLLGMVL
jgi:chromate transporter